MNILTSFELIFSGAPIIFSLMLMIIYFIIRKDLKISNYFRLQFMIVILIDAILRFVKDYGTKKNNNNNENNEQEFTPINNSYKYVCGFRSVFETSILFFLASFSLLGFLTVQKQIIYESRKRAYIKILSLICWLFPMIYILAFFIYFTIKGENDNIIEWMKSILVLKQKNKIISDIILFGILFLIDIILFVFIMIKLFQYSKQKRKMNENVSDKSNHYLRIFSVFISQIYFFVIIILSTIDTYIYYFKENKEKETNYTQYSNLLYVTALSILSFFYAFDFHVSNYLSDKIAKYLNFKYSLDKEQEIDYIGGGGEEDEYIEEEEEGDDLGIIGEKTERLTPGIVSRNSGNDQ